MTFFHAIKGFLTYVVFCHLEPRLDNCHFVAGHGNTIQGTLVRFLPDNAMCLAPVVRAFHPLICAAVYFSPVEFCLLCCCLCK